MGWSCFTGRADEHLTWLIMWKHLKNKSSIFCPCSSASNCRLCKIISEKQKCETIYYWQHIHSGPDAVEGHAKGLLAFWSLTFKTSILRPLSDEGPSGICRACTNASVNCCTTGKIKALAAPYTYREAWAKKWKILIQNKSIHMCTCGCLTFSSSSIAQMRLAQVVNISTALDRVRMLYTCNVSRGLLSQQQRAPC